MINDHIYYNDENASYILALKYILDSIVWQVWKKEQTYIF